MQAHHGFSLAVPICVVLQDTFYRDKCVRWFHMAWAAARAGRRRTLGAVAHAPVARPPVAPPFTPQINNLNKHIITKNLKGQHLLNTSLIYHTNKMIR